MLQMGRNERAKQIIAAHKPYDTVSIVLSRPDDTYIAATYNGTRTFFKPVGLILDGGIDMFPPKGEK